MSRRRGLGAGVLLLATLTVLIGCTDVAAETQSSPSAKASSPSKTKPAATTTPTAIPTGTATKPTVKPTTKPKPQVKPASYALQVERKLAAYGFPVGDVDGVITTRARQALCAWRETNGLAINRGNLTAADIKSVLSATKRPVPTKPAGIYVNKTCQVLYQVVNKTYRRIVWVSTGGPGYDTPNRTGKVWRKFAGAHESSLYKDAFMYDSIYFLKDRPGIALHGSRVNSLIKTYPASHRCVRVMRPQIHEIFDETPIGTTVSVYGKY
jgi:lipoprotein-anchoring transpeptidase ErfK/SrfK